MTPPDEQRRLLGAFLRARRERLTPAAARVPEGNSSRRRTPGLRREEVAQLCSLSPTWYTWLEQGRDVSLSSSALARLAAALRLTAAERAYLFELTDKRDPDVTNGARSELASPPVPVLDAITTPAYVLDQNWHACGWNAAAAGLFSQWLEGAERNLLRYVFLESSARKFICHWENRARRLVAEFRADIARHASDPEVTSLVQGLRVASTEFAQLWSDHSVLTREGGMREFNHPQRGTLRYEQNTFVPAAQPGYKMVVLIPV